MARRHGTLGRVIEDGCTCAPCQQAALEGKERRSGQSEHQYRLPAAQKPLPDTGWMSEGRCAIERQPVSVFFPERGTHGEELGRACAVCDCCKVREECLEFAMVTNQQYGIWGGLSGRERRQYRRRMQKETA